MSKTIRNIVAIAAVIAIPGAMAQTTSDQQVITPKPVPKMTAEEAKADRAAKAAAAKAAEDAKAGKPAPTMSNDQQLLQPKPVPKMTEAEKAADKAAKRKAPTPQELADKQKREGGG